MLQPGRRAGKYGMSAAGRMRGYIIPPARRVHAGQGTAVWREKKADFTWGPATE
jgi:hypothetical protein